MAAGASCTAILGNDFTIIGGAGGGASGGAGPGSGGSGGSGASSTGGGGMGGGMGGEGPGPLSCDWATMEQVQTLEGDPSGFREYNGGQMYMSETGRLVRWTVGRPDPNNSDQGVILFSADEDNVNITTVTGHEGFSFVRLDGQNHALPVAEFTNSPQSRILRLLVLDDDDEQGTGGTFHELTTLTGDIQHFEARALSPGDGTALVLYTAQLDTGPFEAHALEWDGVSAGTPVLFDDSSGHPSYTDGDYEFAVATRDGIDNHVVLGTAFDGGTRTRHFVIPDGDLASAAIARDEPASLMQPVLVDFHRRSTGDFTVSYAALGAAAPELYMGILPGSELATHDPADLPLAASLTANSIPGEAQLLTTTDSLLLVGTENGMPLGLRAVIVHRLSGVRFDEFIPFPDAGIFPTDFDIQRVSAASVDGDVFDTFLGGDIYVAFHLVNNDGTDPHSEMFFGRLECGPP
jgi:hypothetical protein